MPQTVLCRGVGVQSLPVEEKDGELAGLRVFFCFGYMVMYQNWLKKSYSGLCRV